MALLVVAVLILAAMGYLAFTRPCQSGHHHHRHLRRHHHYRFW